MMFFPKPSLWVTVLCAGLAGPCLSQAHADSIVTLQGVTFADGGTASGYFEVDAYGYLEAVAITTTPGTSMADAPIAGYTYASGSVNSFVPFDTGFYFNSTVDAFSLALDADYAVTIGGFDPLVTGSGSGSLLAGSHENCQENPTDCSGVSYLDGRLITAGILYTPEPGSLSLLGAAGVLLSFIRRKRAEAGLRTA
jgi:hypothetical protein